MVGLEITPRQPILLSACNAVFYSWLAVSALLWEVLFPPFLLCFLVARRGRFREAIRVHNRFYGYYVAAFCLRPILKITYSGLENVPKDRPVMILMNHRSSFDIMFSCLLGRSNLCVFVRRWPLRLPLIGWFMRLGGYVDIEHADLDDLLQHVSRLADTGVCWVGFPEGHRTRDGRLQPFHSVCFRLATAAGLDILPVCVTGSGQFCGPGTVLMQPANAHVHVMPPVSPASFPENKRSLQLRRHVEALFKEYLDE